MTKKKYGIRTVNGNEPDPETGNVEVSGGGSQTLQQTLEAGNIAEFEGGNSRVKLLKGDRDSRTIELVTGDGSIRSSVSLGNTYASLSHSEPAPGHVHSNITATNEGIDLSNNDNGTNGWSNAFKVPNNTTSQTTYTLPIDRPNGNYTLATVDQIKGGSQNLEQTLANGNAVGEGYNIQLHGSNNTSIIQNDGIFFFDYGTGNSSIVNAKYYKSELTHDVSGTLYNTRNMTKHNGNELNYRQFNTSDPALSYTLNVSLSENGLPLGNNNVNIEWPVLPDGNYTLATTDDCIPYTGAVNDLNMGGKVIKVGLNDATPATVTTLGYSNGLSGFVSDSPGAKVSYDMQRIEVLNKTSGYKKSLYYNVFADKDYILSLPNKSGELATTDDIAVSNNTSTALSSTFLNETYPDAVLGFQVICDSLLSSGGEHTIYVKSRAGWLKILGEPVP